MLAYYFTKNVPEDYQQPINKSLAAILATFDNSDDLRSPIRFIVSLVNFILNYHDERHSNGVDDDDEG